jgi:hypothetical protein
MISPRSSAASSLKLGRLALIGAGAALLAVACSIGNVDDNEPPNGQPNTGGQAGEGGDTSTGGATTGGTGGSTGGTETGGQGGEVSTGGTGGTGGTIELDCHEDGDADGTYEPLELDECFQCAMDECEAQFTECFAQEPYSVCGFDSTGGSDDSELFCMLECFDELHSQDIFVGGGEDIDDCKTKCESASCSSTEITSPTEKLVECMLGVSSSNGGTACQFECQYRCIGDGCFAHNDDKTACESDTNCTWTE